jgi:putative transposase
MSSKYKISDQQQLYFLTFAVVRWVDVFTRREYKDILIQSLRFCQLHKGLELYAYCIMPNHVHLIASAKHGHTLSSALRDLKKFTANQIIKAIENNLLESRRNWMLWLFQDEGQGNSNNKLYQLWQQETHAVALSDNYMIEQRLNYVHQNPVRAGLCYTAEDYVYSSAGQYSGGEAVLPVVLLE